MPASLWALHIIAFLCFWRAPSVLADNPISPGFPYGSEKVRGVNLGGWLVLEPWITPSLFDATGNANIVDEWTFGQLQSKSTATAALQNHWNTWITESDFAAIAGAGLNHVRLPIGYWAFDVSGGEPYIQGQLPYLQKAVTWAGNHGLKLIVDLHGAPGSQNGFDNSGHRVSFPEWQSNSDNVQRTDNIIKTLADMFKDQTNVVTTIAPLNEPAGFDGDDILSVVRQYWYDSYGNIRFPYGSSQQSNTLVLLHDAFQPLSYWSGFQTPPNWQGVAMDTHLYQVFSDAEVAMSLQDHINTACSKASSLSSFDLWAIVGEWTPAFTDCAKYLNGRGIGSRYDGSFSGEAAVGSCSGKTGSGSSFSSSYKTQLRQYWEAQAQSYSSGAGWIQWAWKAENADDWSYQAGLQYGWIPQNPTNYQYPNICG
ncbi:exo-beta-1,3-glucanase [Punctularia strigosozonata HHB-11173 SS5]|uniref:exo-beta-1,3-glucanase n=1 Tax=Punctularia strigosozonata (strain HHB-11173) TaxID=741275 RepID=UPI00044178A3|nr:exo-beta-1,3-glucanase [Punctularia strigosozonata HHB-11173 SS5]EIN13909.1 exo-beta-1,3-glucanase [Punctularia strigosozonata HHB-11173 SS5]